MKRKVVVLLVVGVVLFGVSAQSANAQNMGQRIIGTWIDNERRTWVFNANGTGTETSGSDVYQFKFGVTDTQLAITDSNGNDLEVYNFSISSDGRTLILDGVFYDDGRIVRGIFWLTKR